MKRIKKEEFIEAIKSYYVMGSVIYHNAKDIDVVHDMEWKVSTGDNKRKASIHEYRIQLSDGRSYAIPTPKESEKESVIVQFCSHVNDIGIKYLIIKWKWTYTEGKYAWEGNEHIVFTMGKEIKMK